MTREKAITLIEKKISFLNNQEDSLHSDVAQLQTLLDDLQETYEGSDEEKEILEVIDAGQFDLEIPTPKLNNKKTKSTKIQTCEVCEINPAEVFHLRAKTNLCFDCKSDEFENLLDLIFSIKYPNCAWHDFTEEKKQQILDEIEENNFQELDIKEESHE